MAKISNTRIRILALSPTYTGGSWVCIEEMLKLLDPQEYDVTTIGLGDGRRLENTNFIVIPYPRFESFNPKYGSNIFINALYQIPLQLLAALHIIVKRPQIILTNGFTPMLLSFPLSKLFNIPVFIYYGSFLARVVQNNVIKLMLKQLDRFVTGVFVNSRGSRDDLSRLVSIDKIQIIEHWTDMQAMYASERSETRKSFGVSENDFILLFVGRFVADKGVPALIHTLNYLEDLPNLYVWFVGDGLLTSQVLEAEKKYPNVVYKGFIKDREELRKYFGVSDMLWTFADETYVAKPGVEGCAVGVPLMIPDTAAVIEKYEQNVKIESDLIPSSIGWIVNDDDPEKVAHLIRDVVLDGSATSMRAACIQYAKEHYSLKNISDGVDKMLSAL